MTGLRLVREQDPPYALCPNCGARLELGVGEVTWTARAPADVADRLVLELASAPHEELHVLALNAKLGVISQDRVYRGNTSASLVRIGELFGDALRRHASGILLVHNHPSGDPTPSPDDLHLTAEVVAGGRLLEIPLFDHVIVGAGRYVSLRERGVAFDGPHRTATS